MLAATAGIAAFSTAGLARAATTAPGVTAAFMLVEGDAKETSTSTGSLALLATGEAYVDVQAPVEQKMWMGPGGLTVFYPNDGTAIKTPTAKGEMPPVFDALLAAIRDPGEILGGKARLKDRSRDGDQLVTRWEAADKDGKPLGAAKVRETADAVLRIEVFGAQGGLAVRYDFKDHRKAGTQRVPLGIEARYFTAKGVEQRFERWTLSDPRPLDAAARELIAGPPPFPKGTMIKTIKKR